MPQDRRLVAPLSLLLVAAALGLAFERIFFGANAIGLNVPLFVVLLLGGAVIATARETVRPQARNLRLLVPPLLFLSAMCFVRANGELAALNILTILGLLILCAWFWVAGDITRLTVPNLIFLPFITSCHALFRAFEPLANALVYLPRRDPKSDVSKEDRPVRRALPFVRGLLLAIPFLLVFGGLLSSADTVFGAYVARFFAGIAQLFENFTHIEVYLPRLILISFVAWVAAGGLTFALTRVEAATVANPDAAPFGNRPLGLTEAATVLGSVNLLFLSFLGLQFSYLFGGAERVMRVAGLSYADYARRGFWELVVVSLLAGGLLLTLREVTKRADEKATRTFGGLGTALIVCTLVLLVSAAQRMIAYETAWGATQLRLIVDVFLVWLALALTWTAATLWRWQDRLVIGILVCALGFIVTLNALNMDNYVVEKNVAIYKKTGRLDTEHLSRLSDDAVPALVHTYHALPQNSDERRRIGDILLEMMTPPPYGKVREAGILETNWSRARARATLSALQSNNQEFRTNAKRSTMHPQF